MILACVLRGDGVTHQLRAGGKTFLFEFDERVGPIVVGKRGQEITQPGAKSPFWQAVSLWSQQGKRTRDGFCIWTPEPVDVLERRGRLTFIVGETPQPDQW